MIGRDKSRRSLTGKLVKNKRQALRRRRKREPQGRARQKYVGMRAGFSNDIYLDEVLDQQYMMHLFKEYRNEPETEALLKLTGMLEVTKKSFVWSRGRSDMKKFMGMAEQLRWDRKKGLSKAEASARFISGKQPRVIQNTIPSFFQAKPTTRYFPDPGSSRGKVKTKQTGAVRVQKDFEKLLLQLFSLGRTAPNVSVSRTMSKTLDVSKLTK
jgi:hypothetical protein